MFEDALAESTGRLKTQSKYWTLGTFALNGGLLAILILIPLLHPEALPKAAMEAMLIAPAPPPTAVHVQTRTAVAARQPQTSMFTAPRRIPTQIHESGDAPPPVSGGPGMRGPGGGVAGNQLPGLIGPDPAIVAVRPKPERVTVSRGVIAGYLMTQTEPVYPVIAKAAHVTGTVLLHAVISKTGTIENLVVESGPMMLRQAALDGVKNWRYRPFLLNGEPTEVDTTITVNFTAGG